MTIYDPLLSTVVLLAAATCGALAMLAMLGLRR